MMIILFYSILASASNSDFINNLNDEEMITTQLIRELQHYETV